MACRTLILIRHGEVPPCHHNRYLGVTDPPLSAEGRRQAAQLAAEVARLAPEKIFASPLRRAEESAALAAPGCAIHSDGRLREIDFGRWENRTFAEITALATPEELRCWNETPELMHFPGGESVPAFSRRVNAFLDEILTGTDESVMLVTHGGVLMHMLGRFYNIPVIRQFELLPPRGSLQILHLENGVLLRHEK